VVEKKIYKLAWIRRQEIMPSRTAAASLLDF